MYTTHICRILTTHTYVPGKFSIYVRIYVRMYIYKIILNIKQDNIMLNISAMKTGRKEINRREKKKSHDKFADMDK